MPSTTLFNTLLDRKKPKDNGGDELAVVKAAAWAWYQHGSGSEGKPISEFGVTRTHRAPRPSRYKLEAERMIEENKVVVVEGLESQRASSIHAGNSLLDSYEVESISKRLDDLIESSSKRFDGDFFEGSHLHRQKSLSNDVLDNGSTSRARKKQQQQQKKKKSFKGFWQRHAVICGTREDVDTRAFVRGRRRGKSIPSGGWPS
ncbi:hypothetical protein Tsubulata_015656 [Turnera subulata]|uniref:Uncharacterized protein n=1 Tax=Turnera subulata TaxID=218843 RepID=A0A9Q0FUN9_9ROSI|nr:hypothetical protein Tsubulata_015656 [Turnera subulata]